VTLLMREVVAILGCRPRRHAHWCRATARANLSFDDELLDTECRHPDARAM
jgi:hypothetical protein